MRRLSTARLCRQAPLELLPRPNICLCLHKVPRHSPHHRRQLRPRRASAHPQPKEHRLRTTIFPTSTMRMHNLLPHIWNTESPFLLPMTITTRQEFTRTSRRSCYGSTNAHGHFLEVATRYLDLLSTTVINRECGKLEQRERESRGFSYQGGNPGAHNDD